MEPSPILQVRRPERLPKFVILALALYAVLLGWSATRHSPTWDEPGHLVAGWSHWKFGRFELYSVNPPLVRSLAAIPIWVANPEMDWGDFEPNPQKRSEVNLGRQLIQRYGDDAVKYLIWGRWACIPLCLLGEAHPRRNSIPQPQQGRLVLTHMLLTHHIQRLDQWYSYSEQR